MSKINRLKYSIIVVLFFSNNLTAQTKTEKNNEIFFLETFIGGYTGDAGGFLWGGDLNYLLNKNLFSVRYSKKNDIDISANNLVGIPTSNTNAHSDEIALLYGRRDIKNRHSWSASVGASYNHYSLNNINDTKKEKISAIGAAFEANIKWFKSKKKNPFGFSYGLKFSGNISKEYYLGLSFILGLGWHKDYNK